MQIKSDEEEIEEMILRGQIPKPGGMYHFANEKGIWSRPVLLLGFYLESPIDWRRCESPWNRTVARILETDQRIRVASWKVFSQHWKEC